MSKIITMYLPQFHVIEENSRFWGEGFTDWVAVQKAKPLFEGHCQPRVPVDNKYYDLSKPEILEKQVELAKDAGISGFCFYHYWFSSKKNLLKLPAENFLKNKSLDLGFCFAWDNASWVRSWSNIRGNDWAPLAEKGNEDDIIKAHKGVMVEYILGNEKDWEIHYDYLKQFFTDSRYIKIENKPVFIIWNYSDRIAQMEEFWNKLAISDGFSGVYFIHYLKPRFNYIKKYIQTDELKYFYYEPAHSAWEGFGFRVKRKIRKILGKKHFNQFSYDEIWHRILKNATETKNKNIFLGAFVDYDDTPRRGGNGTAFIGATPEKFENYLHQLININDQANRHEYIFLTAWNEWGEGAYLEPDKRFGYGYLEAIKNALQK